MEHSLLLGLAMAVRTAIVLVFLVFGVRIFGKSHLGHLTIYDLVMVMLIANTAQNAMTAGKGNISVGLAAAGTLMAVGVLLTYIVVRKPVLSRFITGSPTVLISRGTLHRANMRRENITITQLMRAAREHELNELADIHLAVLEVNGDISIVPKS